MTQLDPGAILNTGPGHLIGEFFGVGGLDVASRHHRGHAGAWSTSPGLRYPAGGTFLERACAVEWEHPSATEHLGMLAYAEPPAAKGGPRTDANGQQVSGAWLPDGTVYDELGHAWPAITEDADRTPPPKPRMSPHLPTWAAIAALVGLIIVACCVTDSGGFD